MAMGNTMAAASVKDTTALTGSYDFGQFTLGGAYQKEASIGNVSGQDVDKYTLGAAMKAGTNGTVKAQYTVAGKIGNLTGSDANQIAVGYDYAYDKATTLYVAYAATKNGLNSSYSAYNWGHGDNGTGTATFAGPTGDKTASAVSVGLVYKFDAAIAR
jgi:predicted porin